MKFNLLLLLFFLIASCQDQNNIDAAETPANQPNLQETLDTILRNGDLIVRSDDDMVGLTLRNMNDSDKTYSHSGFAFKEDNTWLVYNMMAGEENPSLLMRKDSLSQYINPTHKSGFAVYRYHVSLDETDSLHYLLQQQYKQKIRFDTSFNLADDSVLYCSEMIAKNISKTSKGRIQIPVTSKENFSFKATTRGRTHKRNLTYIALDNLYLNEYCRFIISKRYHP